MSISTETTVSGAAANGAIPKVEQNTTVNIFFVKYALCITSSAAKIKDQPKSTESKRWFYYRNPLQHSRKKSLPDSSFLHRSDSSQPPYQPLEMPTGGKISLKTTCIQVERKTLKPLYTSEVCTLFRKNKKSQFMINVWSRHALPT